MNLERFVEKNAPRNRIALLVLVDILLITVSGFLALYIRYDFRFSNMEMRYVDFEIQYLAANLLITILLFVLFKLYRSVWRFASTTELLNVIGACSASILIQIVLMAFLGMRMPVSYYLMKYVLLIVGIGNGALYVPDSPYAPGAENGRAQGRQKADDDHRRRRGRGHDYQGAAEQPLPGSVRLLCG